MRNPVEAAAIRAEIREDPCGVCIRGKRLMRRVSVCTVGKEYPRCVNDKCGFVYDEGED